MAASGRGSATSARRTYVIHSNYILRGKSSLMPVDSRAIVLRYGKLYTELPRYGTVFFTLYVFDDSLPRRCRRVLGSAKTGMVSSIKFNQQGP